MNEFLKYKTLSDESYEGAKIAAPAQFMGCTLIRCSFDHAKISTNLGRKFEDCTFRKANLTESLLRGEFSDCDFTDANLSRTTASEVTFRNCIFLRTNFTKVTYHWIKFLGCKFQECRFRKGEIGSSAFEQCDWVDNEVLDVYAENTKIPAQQGGAGQLATRSESK